MHFMTDIQSASSVSRQKATSCSEEVHSSVVSFHERQLTVLNFLVVVFVGVYIVQLFQAPKKEFSCLKKLFPRDISCELVKGVFPGSCLLCLTTSLVPRPSYHTVPVRGPGNNSLRMRLIKTARYA